MQQEAQWLHWNGCIHSNTAFIKNLDDCTDCSVAVLFQDISKHLFHLSIIGQVYTEYVTSSKSKVHYKGYCRLPTLMFFLVVKLHWFTRLIKLSFWNEYSLIWIQGLTVRL